MKRTNQVHSHLRPIYITPTTNMVHTYDQYISDPPPTCFTPTTYRTYHQHISHLRPIYIVPVTNQSSAHLPHTRTLTHVLTHADAHSLARLHTHTHTHTHTRSHTHARTHTDIHTHTHTHTSEREGAAFLEMLPKYGK